MSAEQQELPQQNEKLQLKKVDKVKINVVDDTPKGEEENEDDKKLDKLAYNVTIDMIKGLGIGLLATLAIRNKKAALSSGFGFGVGQGYTDFLLATKYCEKDKKKKSNTEALRYAKRY